VTFDSAKPRLKPAAKKALDAVAATLRKFPGVRVRVDGRAGKGVKDDLARRRAEAVKWYLIDAGIAADRIDTDGVPADAGPARVELQLVAPPAATP
jgi:outer membrane protein OmpA-like peptidoglycan-associated protein